MRIYIIGHGWDLQQPMNDNRQAIFYVNSGTMLDNVVIPRIITDTNIRNDVGNGYQNLINQCALVGHIRNVSSNEHLIVNYRGNLDLYNCRLNANGQQINVPNHNGQYYLNRDGNVIQTGIQPQIVNIPQRNSNLCIHNCIGTNAGNILVHPEYNGVNGIDGPTPVDDEVNLGDFIHLSDIIEYFKNYYLNKDLEFYWLACRSHI